VLWLDERVGGRVVEHRAVEGDAAAVERGQPGERAQHGALARAVGAEQRQQLAGPHLQIGLQVERA
jgi:hypothetical protein